MCGIVGYIGNKEALPVLLRGLRSLEYRGYDSAGIAVLQNRGIFLRKRPGKLSVLQESLRGAGVTGTAGIGHTRWATHGEPNEVNAHPHFDCGKDFMVVHNGIIENHQELRSRLLKQGHTFRSQTDTEVIAHLLEKAFRGDLRQAVSEVIRKLEGSFALGVVTSRQPNVLIGARKDSPLIVGLGKGENFIASDVPAILAYSRQVIYLDNDEVVELTRDSARLFDKHGRLVRRKPTRISWDAASAEKAGYRHFMLKEIFEQPRVLRQIIQHRVKGGKITFENITLSQSYLRRIDNIQIVACGTAYHAGLCAKYILEKLLNLPVNVDTSSEFRYRTQIIKKDRTLIISVSQSGETADTLASLRAAKRRGAKVVSLCNVVGSSIARESDGVIYTLAGPEIAVASTKAYTAQLATFYLLGLYLGRVKATISRKESGVLLAKLSRVPALMEQFLKGQENVKAVADHYVKRYNYRLADQFRFLEDKIALLKDNRKALEFADQWAKRCLSVYGRRFGDFPFLYLGRNINYPSALEGALKLKEITYISAEGYAAGEMKHGPIALIDEFPLVVCIANNSGVYDKMLSNIREIKSRKGVVLAIATQGDTVISHKDYSDYVIHIPLIDEFISPLLVALPLQLLAYYIAVGLGCDVDQPRNLAKSVTVE